jgi:hypothetical protein
VTGREEGDGCGGGGTAVVSGGRLASAVIITPFVEVRVGRRAMDAMGAPPQPQIDRRAELEGMVSEGRRRAGRHRVRMKKLMDHVLALSRSNRATLKH